MSKRNRIARVSVAVAALVLLAGGFAWRCRQQPADLSSWNEDRPTHELEGLGYHTHAEPADRRTPEGRLVLAGLYCWRDGAATSWEEGARQMAGQAVKWRGLVVARPSPRSIAPEPAAEALQVGGWVLLGDPAELDRIGAGLGLPP